MSHLPIIRKRPMSFPDSAEETFCSHCDDLWPCEVHELQKENERLRATLPETFYADRPLVERVEQIVRIWKNAIEANKALETRIEAAYVAAARIYAALALHVPYGDCSGAVCVCLECGNPWNELGGCQSPTVKALRGEDA